MNVIFEIENNTAPLSLSPLARGYEVIKGDGRLRDST